jgi:hypothetical protein
MMLLNFSSVTTNMQIRKYWKKRQTELHSKKWRAHVGYSRFFQFQSLGDMPPYPYMILCIYNYKA